MRSSQAEYHVKEGLIVGIPVGEGLFKPALIARVGASERMLIYLTCDDQVCAGVKGETPSIRVENSVPVLTGQIGVRGGRWPILAKLSGFTRDNWPIPVLRAGFSRKTYQIVRLNEDTMLEDEVRSASSAEVKDLSKDSWPSIPAVEIRAAAYCVRRVPGHVLNWSAPSE